MCTENLFILIKVVFFNLENPAYLRVIRSAPNCDRMGSSERVFFRGACRRESDGVWRASSAQRSVRRYNDE